MAPCHHGIQVKGLSELRATPDGVLQGVGLRPRAELVGLDFEVGTLNREEP